MANDFVNKSTSKLKIKDIKLNSLLEVTKAINDNYSTDRILEIYEFVLKTQLNIGRLILFSHDSEWKCLLKYGVEKEYQDINVEKELLQIKEIKTIDFISNSLNKSFEIVIPVFHKSKPLAYALIGDIEDKLEVSPAIKHLPFVQTLTNIIVVAIENKKLAKESVRKAAIEKELELASQMQSMLFPSFLPSDDKLDVDAFYLPHQQVGGDYYDYLKLSETEIVFCMADVSGKGVAAALLMSNFQANLRVLVNHHATSLTDLVRELNVKVMASAKGEKFITFFIAKYNLETRVLNYINAAHTPPILTNGDSASLLKIGCTGLGMFDELPSIKEGIVNISPNMAIISYTDGVVELENEKGEDFGIDAFKEMVRENSHLKMNALNKLLIDKLFDFKGKKPYMDDIALFSCRFF